MLDAVTVVPEPVNEPVRSYAPGSPERASLERRLKELAAEAIDLPLTIGGRSRAGGGEQVAVVMPHRHSAVLGYTWNAVAGEVSAAIDAAAVAAPAWRALPFDERAAVFLKAADLLAARGATRSTPRRCSGSPRPATRPRSTPPASWPTSGASTSASPARSWPSSRSRWPRNWNRLDHRPLEGFVLAITPFNFTSIAGNLPTAPALMGCTVVWKPSPDPAVLRALPDAPARGGRTAAGRHQPGHRRRPGGLRGGACRTPTSPASTSPARPRPSSTCGARSARTSPATAATRGWWGRPAARTSSSPTPRPTSTRCGSALIRGAFEFQGQKCSAASRAYIPRSLWDRLRDDLVAETNAPADGRRHRLRQLHGRGHRPPGLRPALGRARPGPQRRRPRGPRRRQRRRHRGLLRPADRPARVRPDPRDLHAPSTSGRSSACSSSTTPTTTTSSAQAADAAPYALTGAIFAQDRAAIVAAQEALRFSAGNFYVNDKPTGAVVGQQPFGGARASGTNDKAGSMLNLLRWTSPRAIKENFLPPSDWRYPHMG